ncbi:hypothetical protein QQF64_020086 [Cirrhinus molitorella]|uniref:Uncharacterized protein n=1 Tax=Cirrhinus molitorella TaxID=172907 RepID=A0ABR3LHG0_9TELE
MNGIIPRSKAKGTDICATENWNYIIRSDLGCYMQTSDLNKGSDISICHLHPACQNGDHYIADNKGYFHIIKGNSCRKVSDLSTDSDAEVYSLHPSCQGGDHYLSTFHCFYIIFQEKGTLRVTTDMKRDSDAKERTLDPEYRDGLYYWQLQLKDSLHMYAILQSFLPSGCYFSFLKPTCEWGVEYYTVFAGKCYSVHPDVLNFLPGGLSVTKGPAIGMWENIKTIINDSNTAVTWQKKITKKVGYSKKEMTQITHNWKIETSASIESGTLAKLIAKWQFSLSLEYGGSHVSTKSELWNKATEEEELLTFELKPKESLYLWQHKLCLGEESVLFCRHLKITNEPNPPTEALLPSAQP